MREWLIYSPDVPPTLLYCSSLKDHSEILTDRLEAAYAKEKFSKHPIFSTFMRAFAWDIFAVLFLMIIDAGVQILS